MLPAYVPENTYSPNQEDVTHAVLSLIAYEVNNIQLGSKSWERVNAALSREADRIGTGWSVARRGDGTYMSSLDSVVVVNPFSGHLSLLARGTDFKDEFVRDFIANDLGGAIGVGGHRVPTTLVLAQEALEYATAKNYKMTLAGHSLGGSVVSVISSILHLPVYTFNAPELLHSISLASLNKAQNPSTARNWRLENDVVSLLGNRRFEERGISTTLPFEGNPVQAHMMVNVLQAMGASLNQVPLVQGENVKARLPVRKVIKRAEEMMGYQGGVDWSSSQTSVEVLGHVDVHNHPTTPTFNPVLQSIVSQTVTPQNINNSSIHLNLIRFTQETTKGNLLFSRVLCASALIHPESLKVESVEIVKRVEASIHTRVAMQSAAMATANYVANVVISKDVKFKAGDIAKHAGEVALKSFTGSVIGSQLKHHWDAQHLKTGVEAFPVDISANVANGGVSAAFDLLHGNPERAMQTTLETTANTLLQSATGLPLSFHHSHKIATGQMFGSGVTYSEETQHHLGVSLPRIGVEKVFGGVSAGAFQNRVHDVYSKHGQVVEREAHGAGAYAQLGPASVSLGLYNGHETITPKTTIIQQDNNLIERTEWGERNFQGELMIRFGAGNRLGVFSLPAWKEVMITQWSEVRADGKPFSIITNLPNQILPNPILPNPINTNLPNQIHPNPIPSNSVLMPEVMGQCKMQVISPDSDLGSKHEEVPINPMKLQYQRKMTHQDLDNNLGRTETVDRKYGTGHTKREYIGLKKTSFNQEFQQGTIHETSVEKKDPVLNSDTGIVTVSSHKTDLYQDYTDLLREQHIKRRLLKTRVSNSYYAPGERRTLGTRNLYDLYVESEFKEDGSHICESRRDNDRVHDEVFEKFKEENYHNNIKIQALAEEYGISHFTDKETSTAKLENGNIIQEDVTEITHSSFIDTRMISQDKVITTFAPGENRESTEIGVDRYSSQIERKEDNTPISQMHNIGMQSVHGVTGEAMMDVYSYSRDSLDRKSVISTENTHKMTENAHGTFVVVQHGSESQETSLSWKNVPATAKTIINNVAYGNSDCITKEIDSTKNQHDIYSIGEHDLNLQTKEVQRQTMNTYQLNTKNPLVSKTDYIESTKTTITQLTDKVIDLTVETFKVEDNQFDISQIPTLSPDQGGPEVITTNGKIEPNNTPLSPSSVQRNRKEIGVQLTHKDYDTQRTARSFLLSDSETLYDQEYTFYERTSEIESGSGPDAQIKETAIAVEKPHLLIQGKITETDGWFTTETKHVQQITELDKGTTEHKTIEVQTDLSQGCQRGLSAASGAITNMILKKVVDGQNPTPKDLGHSVVSTSEAFVLGHAIKAAASGNLMQGCLAAGVACGVASVVHLALEKENKSIIDKGTEIAANLVVAGAPMVGKLGGNSVFAASTAADIIKNTASYAQGKITTSELALKTGQNMVSYTGGSVLSSMGTSVIAQVGIGGTIITTVSGAVLFTVGSYLSYKIASNMCSYWQKHKGMREKEERRKYLLKKYQIPAESNKIEFDSLRRKLQRTVHPDKDGSEEEFLKLTEELQELCVLQIECGPWKDLGDSVYSYVGYLVGLFKELVEQKEIPLKEAFQSLCLLLDDKSYKEYKEKKTQ